MVKVEGRKHDFFQEKKTIQNVRPNPPNYRRPINYSSPPPPNPRYFDCLSGRHISRSPPLLPLAHCCSSSCRDYSTTPPLLPSVATIDGAPTLPLLLLGRGGNHTRRNDNKDTNLWSVFILFSFPSPSLLSLLEARHPRRLGPFEHLIS